ncbi:MAG: class I SAM-dependent methyltransferase [Anaerolineales bacterium]|nr:class I SAM-dependent methyltransferase [Anaerolineales bacterium]
MTNDTNYWEAIAGSWQEKPRQQLWRAHSDAVNCALLSRWLPEKVEGRILKTDLFDEAISRGLCHDLAERARVFGIDISIKTASAAHSRCNSLQAFGSDVRRLAVAGGSFSGIVSNSTLDHFITSGDITTSIREIYRVLKPGGFLLITLDNLTNPLIMVRNLFPISWLNRLGIVPYKVGVTMKPGTLCRTLESVGFDVLEVDAIMHCPRFFAVALAGILEKQPQFKSTPRFMQILMAFERLSHWPSRFLTGHMMAVLAVKRNTD